MTTQKRSIVGKKTARLKAKKRDSALAIRLQNLATSIFITGFTGAIVATRLLGATSGANVKHRPLTSDLGVASQTFVADSSSTTNAQMQLQKTRGLLLELRNTIELMNDSSSEDKQQLQMQARNIARSLSVIARIVPTTPYRNRSFPAQGFCAQSAEAAVLYLSATIGSLANGAAIGIQGTSGSHDFSFASGTSQAGLIQAINSFSKTLGVEAEQSNLNPHRVEIHSLEVGADEFVQMSRLTGGVYVFTSPMGGQFSNDFKDYGKNAITLQNISD
ncbi:MAG: hypothetical protein IH984_09870 [Planctomycetes bacterium]|nr:hypothetical protein [Planctomycetota bacterium]